MRFEEDDDEVTIYVDADGDMEADFSLQLGEEDFELDLGPLGGIVPPEGDALVAGDFILGDTPVLLLDDAFETLVQDEEEIGLDYKWMIRQDGTSQIGTLTLTLDPTDRNTLHQLQLASGVVLLDSTAENVTIGGDGSILILTDMECRSEITLNFEVVQAANETAPEVGNNFPENAVVLTTHIADDDPTVDEFDSTLEDSIIAVFGGEGVETMRSTGAGDGDVVLMPLIDEGSAVSGFGVGDAIIIRKDPEERPEIEIEPLDGEPGGVIVTINGVSHIIQFEPGELGGEVMVLDMGGEIKFQFMTYLPELSDGQAVNPDLVNGVVNPDFLTGVEGRVFDVTLENLGLAGYDNVVGCYHIAEDGSISNIRILYENANQEVGDTEQIDDLAEGSQLGFFLIQDGADWLATQDDFDGFTFVEADEDPGNADGGEALFLSVDGVLQTDLTILHSYDSDLNEDGMVHVLTGISEGDQSITLGFEDMTNGGDYDFEDVGLLIEYSDIPA